jgi:hypothetical protein
VGEARVDDRRWIPPRIDVNMANPARVYDFLLGGTHNFPADRWSALRAVDDHPVLPAAALANRAFLQRAVRHLINAGVRQFIELGSGIPAGGHVHEIAQSVDPGATVVYVDADPVAAAHGHALLAGTDTAAMVAADVRDVPLVLAAPPLRRLISMSRPVGILAIDVLQWLADADDPAGVLGRYRDAVPPGSHVVVSHPVAESAGRRPDGATVRTPPAIAGLLEGWRPVPPGLVPIARWHPAGGEDPGDDAERVAYLAGVARQP